jgi:hypothetical protein
MKTVHYSSLTKMWSIWGLINVGEKETVPACVCQFRMEFELCFGFKGNLADLSLVNTIAYK